MSDSAECWKHALTSPAGRDEADMVNGARIIGGGVFALANKAAEDAAYKGDPKKDLGNWSAHNSCMQRKGYKLQLAGW